MTNKASLPRTTFHARAHAVSMEALRVVLLCFFVSHIPATLLVDSQAGAHFAMSRRAAPHAALRSAAEAMGPRLRAEATGVAR